MSAQTAAAAVAAVGSGSEGDIERFASLVQQRNGRRRGTLRGPHGRRDRIDARRTRRRRPVPHARARARHPLTPHPTCLLQMARRCVLKQTERGFWGGEYGGRGGGASARPARGRGRRRIAGRDPRGEVALAGRDPGAASRRAGERRTPDHRAVGRRAAGQSDERAAGGGVAAAARVRSGEDRHVRCRLRAGDRARRSRHRPLRASRCRGASPARRRRSGGGVEDAALRVGAVPRRGVGRVRLRRVRARRAGAVGRAGVGRRRGPDRGRSGAWPPR